MPKIPVSCGEFFALVLDEIDHGALVDVIKVAEPVAERIFRGFRPKASSLKDATVRHRLISEIEADDGLKGVVLEIWDHTHSDVLFAVGSHTIQELKAGIEACASAFGGVNTFLALSSDERRGARALAESMSAELLRIRPDSTRSDQPASQPLADAHADRGDRELEEARDRLAHARKDKRELEQRLKSERGRVSGLEKNLAKLRDELAGVREELDDARRREDASESLCRTLTSELAGLRKKLQEQEDTVVSLRRALDDAGARTADAAPPPHSGWQAAVEKLISTGRRSSALDFLLAMAARHSNDPAPHVMLDRLYAESGEHEARRAELLWLARHALSVGDHRQAALCSCRAIALEGRVPSRGSVFWEMVRKTDPKDERRMSNLRIALLEVRQSSEELYDRLLEAVAKESHIVARGLTQAAPVLETERLFDLRHNGAQRVVSPRQIAEAIDRNETEEVRWLRAALGDVVSDDLATVESVIGAVREIDPSAAVALTADNTMPVVVDGSNVAHHARTPDGKPRLRNLLLMRRELRRRGFFPVYVCADDALRCQIDHQSEFLGMLQRGEVELADAKTDADGMIVELARQLGCAMVTNDRMRDWDPECTVPRLRYRIDDDNVEVWEQTTS